MPRMLKWLVVLFVTVLLVSLFTSRRASNNPQEPIVQPGNSGAVPSSTATKAVLKPVGVGRAEEEKIGERIARLMRGDSDEHRLSMSEINDYLIKHKSSAFSLVAAFGVMRDKEFLKQAATNAPGDPFVQTQVLVHNLYPEDREKWINALKESSPQNSLPHFLSAQEQLAKGDVAGALEEINAAENKSYDDFTKEMAFAQEEAYLSAGRSVVEAKALGNSEVLLPQLAPFKKLGVDLAERAVEAGNAGDTASQQAILSATWELGHQLRLSGRDGTLLSGLVGLAIENIALNKWPEGAEAPFLNGSVSDQREKNREIRADIRQVAPIVESWLPTASENELITYFDRLRMFGEWDTLQWLRHQQDGRP